MPPGTPAAIALMTNQVPEIPRIEGTHFVLEEPQWTPCTQACGGGVRTQAPVCISTAMHTSAPLDVCMRHLGAPDERSELCNTQLCSNITPQWRLSSWSRASARCGGGHRVRSADCVANGTTLPDSAACGVLPHQLVLSSNTIPCHNFGWRTSSWSECSARCGWGQTTRSAACVDLHGSSVAVSFCPDSQPPLIMDCYLGPCHAPAAQAIASTGGQRRLHSAALPAPTPEPQPFDLRPQASLRLLLSNHDESPGQDPVQCAFSRHPVAALGSCTCGTSRQRLCIFPRTPCNSLLCST
jgi:hypothetical protein